MWLFISFPPRICNVSKLFAIAEKLHGHLFTTGSQRVYTVLKIDDRRDKEVGIGEKVLSVERRME